jgi:hypothetical protein
LKEGGYEGGGAMVYYGQPGPFAPTIEETIIGKVHDLIRQVRSETSRREVVVGGTAAGECVWRRAYG